MRFDWYQATVVDDRAGGGREGVLVEDLGRRLEAVSEDVGPGRWGYGAEHILRDGNGDVLARVLAGGRQPWPSVQGSGVWSPDVAEALRGSWRHWVTRLDVADDRLGDGAWEALYGPLLGLADARGLTVSQAGDWHRLEAGRTLYVGSRASSVYVRLYEKGKQLRGSGQDAPDDWVRLEIQVRPTKRSRDQAATWTPDQVWGASAWTTELARIAAGVDVPRVHMHEKRLGDDARALAALTRQYGSVLSRLWTRLGADDAALGQYLRERFPEAS